MLWRAARLRVPQEKEHFAVEITHLRRVQTIEKNATSGFAFVRYVQSFSKGELQ